MTEVNRNHLKPSLPSCFRRSTNYNDIESNGEIMCEPNDLMQRRVSVCKETIKLRVKSPANRVQYKRYREFKTMKNIAVDAPPKSSNIRESQMTFNERL